MSLTYSNVLNVNKKNYNGVTIEERALSGKINIRGKSSDKEFMKSIGSVLNLVLPIEPNVRIFNNNISIMWLGPNEWLVETPENEKDEIINSDNLKVHPRMKELYKFLKFNGKVVDLNNYNLKSLKIYSHEVLNQIKENSKGWETLLPKAVAAKIKKFNLFGYNK